MLRCAPRAAALYRLYLACAPQCIRIRTLRTLPEYSLQHPKDARYAARHFFPYAGWLDAGEANKVPCRTVS